MSGKPDKDKPLELGLVPAVRTRGIDLQAIDLDAEPTGHGVAKALGRQATPGIPSRIGERLKGRRVVVVLPHHLVGLDALVAWSTFEVAWAGGGRKDLARSPKQLAA